MPKPCNAHVRVLHCDQPVNACTKVQSSRPRRRGANKFGSTCHICTPWIAARTGQQLGAHPHWGPPLTRPTLLCEPWQIWRFPIAPACYVASQPHPAHLHRSRAMHVCMHAEIRKQQLQHTHSKGLHVLSWIGVREQVKGWADICMQI